MPPDVVPVSDSALQEIGRRHSLRFDRAEPIRSDGIINTIYSLGQRHVLRVPRNHPAHIQQAYAEALAIPTAIAAGVRMPGLLAFDDSKSILPVPYLIVERVHGRDLESLRRYPPDAAGAWRQLGQDLARLHLSADRADPATWPENPVEPAFADPRALIDERIEDGWISPTEGEWLARWLDRLAARQDGAQHRRRVHGDIQLSNFLIDPTSSAYLAVIDWGCARHDDSAADFLAMPMAAVPHLLAGHRDVAPLEHDDTAEARILWRRIQLMLGVLPRGAAPAQAWGERPVAWLIDLLRFFRHPPNDRWSAVAPD